MRFQFHIGAIKITAFRRGTLNPKTFQFHIGAIKILFAVKELMFGDKFQFHIGAIKMLIPPFRRRSLKSVSIPYWCD